MIKSHKIRLKANKEQRIYCAKSAGVARGTYNWALAKWKELYEAGEKPNEADLRKMFNKIKYTERPYVSEVSSVVPARAIMNLGNAFKRFFKGQAKYPQFKCKGKRDSFYISNTKFKVDGKRICLPKIGWVRMYEELRFKGKIMSATVSRRADRWFVSIAVEVQPEIPLTEATRKDESKSDNQAASVGIDLGVKEFATLSDGETTHNPRFAKKFKSQVRRANKFLSHKKGFKKGEEKSRNFLKAKLRLQKIYYRLDCCRNDFLHKTTTAICRKYDVIGIENLDVKGMVKTKYLAGLIYDASLYEFRRQMTYKAEWYGKTLVVADKAFPSTEQCSECGERTPIELRIRKWVCPHCGTKHHRDINAAVNLRNNAVGYTVSACGEFLSSVPARSRKQDTSMKQEWIKQQV